MPHLKKQEVKELLLDLVRTKSFTNEESAIASLIAKRMHGYGFFDVRIDDFYNVIVSHRFQIHGKKLALMVNTDTGKPNGDFPKSGVTKEKQFGNGEECVIGLGAAAPKASIAAMMIAAKEILTSNVSELAGELVLCFVVRDLLANHDGPRAIASEIRDVDFLLCAEPTGNTVVSATRGIMQLQVSFEATPLHWGQLDRAGNLLYICSDFLQMLGAEDVHDDPMFGKTGFNPIMIDCTAKAPNTPSKVEIRLDRRILPGEVTAEIPKRLYALVEKSLVSRSGIEYEITELSKMFAFEGDREGKEAQVLDNITRRLTKREPQKIIPKFASNAAFFTHEFGTRGLIFGPGRLENKYPIEHVPCNELIDAVEIYKDFMKQYLQKEA